ncbi:MAG: dTMP kinase [Promethearchaeota archaeon]
MSWGILIVFEGIDGAGTTTQARRLRDFLERQGTETHLTAEPSQGLVGQVLRKALKDGSLDPHTDALLFAADRVEHTYKEILPMIHENKVVICDRYLLSSVCYQSASGEVPADWILEINRRAVEPDLTVILDVDPRVSLERIAGRDEAEKFETIEFLDKVRARYKMYVKPPTTVEVDASRSEEEIFRDIIHHIEETLGCEWD